MRSAVQSCFDDQLPTASDSPHWLFGGCRLLMPKELSSAVETKSLPAAHSPDPALFDAPAANGLRHAGTRRGWGQCPEEALPDLDIALAMKGAAWQTHCGLSRNSTRLDCQWRLISGADTSLRTRELARYAV